MSDKTDNVSAKHDWRYRNSLYAQHVVMVCRRGRGKRIYTYSVSDPGFDLFRHWWSPSQIAQGRPTDEAL